MEDELIYTDVSQVIQDIDNITEVVGSDDENATTKIITFLTDTKEFLSTVDTTIKGLQTELESTNKRCLDLQRSNNVLMRKVIVNEETEQAQSEEQQSIDTLTDFFE